MDTQHSHTQNKITHIFIKLQLITIGEQNNQIQTQFSVCVCVCSSEDLINSSELITLCLKTEQKSTRERPSPPSGPHGYTLCPCVCVQSKSLSLSLGCLSVETHWTNRKSELLFGFSEIRHGHIDDGKSVRVREVEGEFCVVLTQPGLRERHSAVCYYIIITELSYDGVLVIY